MTEWIILPRRIGKRRAPDARVTMNWRHDRKGKNAYVIISQDLRSALGWPDPTKVQVAHDAAHTMLRLMPAAEGRSSAKRSGGTTMYVALPWVESPPRPAALCEHRVEGQALIIVLPDWARPAPDAAGQSAPEDPPAPPAKSAPPAPTVASPATWPDAAAVMTPERDALFTRAWLDPSYTLPAIHAAINDLPGRTIPIGSLYGIARQLGLKPRQAAIAERANQPRDPRSRPGPRPAHTIPAPDDPLSPLPADDLAEARRMIASNRHGAADLARHFGWAERDAIRIAAALRDEIEAEAATRRRVA